jgi:hypothetical protein
VLSELIIFIDGVGHRLEGFVVSIWCEIFVGIIGIYGGKMGRVVAEAKIPLPVGEYQNAFVDRCNITVVALLT